MTVCFVSLHQSTLCLISYFSAVLLSCSCLFQDKICCCLHEDGIFFCCVFRVLSNVLSKTALYAHNNVIYAILKKEPKVWPGSSRIEQVFKVFHLVNQAFRPLRKMQKKYVTNGLKLPNFIAYLNPNECLIMPQNKDLEFSCKIL